ncbi:enoyl-[acyl-carrier-protein] reductase FabK [Pediococcus stilesii]|uniref:Probable nitronate monooxygenase n=1 Tax=Pediococcus stilesii TaxID=331679 RepID=A0A5R9BZ51_9LACO|nr:nitronate monooxygenase [Pediococcus stilesii]TLQ05785.1 enoyl-[acyl-carrier-protein] reductase FabK [Pediococcus stilesii]
MNRVTKLLDIKYPIIQGAMQEVATAELAAAVSNGGGLGIIAAGGKKPEEVREEIKKAKKLTKETFAVNLMLMDPNTPDVVKVVIEEGVKVVTTGAGTPKNYMKDLKAANIIVMPVVPNVKIAKKMEAMGVDAVIVEGMEGGGHIGSLTSMVLWPQVADAVSIPLIAAGGIGDGRGVVSAFVAGAEGVQCGTIFSIAKESPVGDNWRNAVIDATDSSTIVVGQTIRDASRAIKNRKTDQLLELEEEKVSREEFNESMNVGLRNAVRKDNADTGVLFSGAISGLIKESQSAGEIVSSLVNQAKDIIDNKKIELN